MSIPTQPIDVRVATDPRIARGPMAAVLTAGPTSTTFKTVQATGPTSLAPTFNWINTSKATGVSRRIILRAQGTITFTAAANVVEPGAAIALRPYPLQSNMNNCTLSLDSVPLAIQQPTIAVPLLALIGNSASSMALEQSGADVRPDVFADYANDVTAAVSGIYGSNPAGGSYSTALIGGRNRGIQSIGGAGADVMTVNFDITEPLIVSPCASAGGLDSKYFFGVQQFNLSVAYGATGMSMLSLALLAAPANPLVASLAFTNQWIEYEECMVSDAMLLAPARPWSYHLAYTNVFTASVAATLDAGATKTATSAVLNVTTVPSRLLIAAVFGSADRAAVGGARIPNVCFRLSNVRVTVGGRDSLFAAASSQQLYEVSRRAGVLLPYAVWAGAKTLTDAGTSAGGALAGGPLVIPMEYLSLPDGVFPGSQQQLQIQVSASVTNQTPTNSTSPTFVLIAITDGILTALDGVTAIQLGVPQSAVDSARKTSSPADVALVAASHQEGGYQGGAWYNDFARGFMMPINAVAKLGPLAAAVAAPELMPVAAAFQKLTGNGAVVGGMAVQGGGRKKGGAALRLM